MKDGGSSNASNLVLGTGITLYFGGNAATATYTIAGGAFDGGGNLWIVSGAKVDFASSTTVDLPFKNDGTIEIGSGTLTLQGALKGSGSITMDAGTTLALAAPQGFTNSILVLLRHKFLRCDSRSPAPTRLRTTRQYCAR